MIKKYTITGMTCEGCLLKVKKAINSFPSIEVVDIQLDYPQVNIFSNKSLNFDEINFELKKRGNYTIVDTDQAQGTSFNAPLKSKTLLPEKSMSTYLP